MTYEEWLRLCRGRLTSADNNRDRMEAITTMYATMTLLARQNGYDLDVQLRDGNLDFINYYDNHRRELAGAELSPQAIRAEAERVRGGVFLDTLSRINGSATMARVLSDRTSDVSAGMRAFTENAGEVYETAKLMNEQLAEEFKTPDDDREIARRRETLGQLLQSLRDDGRGKNWFGKERKSNSPGYEAAVAALEKVVKKLDAATPPDKETDYGALPTWEDNRELLLAVKNYMSDKLTVRSTESGQLRVSALLSAVNAVTPAGSRELNDFYRQINSARGAREGEAQYVAVDHIPQAKGTIGAMMEAGRQELLSQKPPDMSKEKNIQTLRRLFALEELAKNEATGVYAKFDKAKAAELERTLAPGVGMGVALDATAETLKKDPNALELFLRKLGDRNQMTNGIYDTVLRSVPQLMASRIRAGQVDGLDAAATAREQNMTALAANLNRLGAVNQGEMDLRRDWQAKREAKQKWLDGMERYEEDSDYDLAVNPYPEGTKQAQAYQEIYEKWFESPRANLNGSGMSLDDSDMSFDDGLNVNGDAPQSEFDRWLDEYDRKPQALLEMEQRRQRPAGPVLGG